MNLSPLPIQKFFANNGRPLVGGKLFTYEAGTTTKIATYTDSSGLTPNTNPIILDFRGECRLWIDPQQAYKFTLSPANDTDPPTRPIWTVDDITVAPQAFDNAAVDTGSVNNISLSIPQISSPVAFTRVVFQAANTNTGATTIQINGGTALPLIFPNGDALTGGEVQAGGIYQAIFDGGSWQFQGNYYLQDYHDYIKAEYFYAGTVAPTAVARFYAAEEITEHAHYAFLDESLIEYAGGAPIYGHASFDDNVTFIGSVASDHHHSFQSYPHYDNSGIIGRIAGFYSIGDVTDGTVSHYAGLHVDDPTGAGIITNLYGVYVNELDRGSGNSYAYFSEGRTKSCFGGDVQLGSPSTPAAVKYNYDNGNLELIPRTTFKTHVQSSLLIGTADEGTAAEIENTVGGDLEITARATFNIKMMSPTQASHPLKFPAYTVAVLNSAVLPGDWTNCLCMCSNEAGGFVPVFSDGVNWRRVTDRNIIS